MIFALACSLATLLLAAGTAVPYTKDKKTYFPKAESWMLKPPSASDEHHKPPTKSSSSVYEGSSWFVTAFYGQNSFCNPNDVIMKTGVPCYTCLQTGEFSSAIYYCSPYSCKPLDIIISTRVFISSL